MTTPPRAAPALAAITTAALMASATLNTTAARHSDIPDLPPAPPPAATHFIIMMQSELAAYQALVADERFLDPASRPLLNKQAMDLAHYLNVVTAQAHRDLIAANAPPSELAAVHTANAAAQQRLACFITPRALTVAPPMPPPGFEPGTKRL